MTRKISAAEIKAADIFMPQQQNSLYPATSSRIVIITPQTRFGSSIMINIPIAVQNIANPQTFFILPLPKSLLIHHMLCVFILFGLSQTDLLSYSSSESRMSITSSSVIRSSFFAVNRSTTSGTRSRSLVTVSWFLILTSLVFPS